MTMSDDDTETHAAEQQPVMMYGPQTGVLTSLARTMATFWMMCLMLAAAGLAGAAFIQMSESQHQLAEEQDKTRAHAWALVTYRNELEAAVDKMRDDPFMEAPPAPPRRPPLQVEIDTLRAQNLALREQINGQLGRGTGRRPLQRGWPD